MNQLNYKFWFTFVIVYSEYVFLRVIKLWSCWWILIFLSTCTTLNKLWMRKQTSIIDVIIFKCNCLINMKHLLRNVYVCVYVGEGCFKWHDMKETGSESNRDSRRPTHAKTTTKKLSMWQETRNFCVNCILK